MSFLPPGERIPMRKSWYQGIITELKMEYVFPIINLDVPTGVQFTDPKHAKKEFIEKTLFTHLNEKVRGPSDSINWKMLSHANEASLNFIEKTLRSIASIPARDKTLFARFFPEVSLLLVKENSGNTKVYSIIHNRGHQNISWILAESLRLAPEEDTLTIREGLLGAYPNMFFVVEENKLATFAKAVLKMKTAKEYTTLVKNFGVPRTQERFWSVYDEVNTQFKTTDPVQFGYLDLTRYEM